jgi:hypothetical protein
MKGRVLSLLSHWTMAPEAMAYGGRAHHTGGTVASLVAVDTPRGQRPIGISIKAWGGRIARYHNS